MGGGEGWVPDACTLPLADQPVRRSEWRAVLSSASSDRVSKTRAVLSFPAGPGRADHLRDLAERENRCCSFFDFAVTESGDRVELAVVVPASQAAVLDGLLGLTRNGR